MAVNRVLSSDEKFALQSDTRFKSLCKQAMLDKASFWMTHDGTAVPGGQIAVPLSRWARSRQYSAGIINQPEQIQSSESRIIQRFIIFLKNIQLWDSTVNGNLMIINTVCDYMVAQSTFDTLADNTFDEDIKAIHF